MRKNIHRGTKPGFVRTALVLGPVFTSLLASAQVTLPGSNGVTVNLSASYPGEVIFTLPAGSSILNAGAAVVGDNSQNWQITNYGMMANTATATVAAALEVGHLASGLPLVNNYGTIQSATASGGTSFGLHFTGGGSVNNYAGGVISGPDAVHADNGAVQVYNAGRITSTTTSAIYGSQGVAVANDTTGIISGVYGVVANTSGSVTVNNYGTISTSGCALCFSGGVYSVYNSGLGIISSSSSSDAAINLNNTNSPQNQLLNYGLISNAQGTAILAKSSQNVLINTGTITGGGIGIQLQGDGNTVYNLGTLTGSTTALQVTGNNNTVVLGTHFTTPGGTVLIGPGPTLNGNVQSTGSGNMLQLTDSGSANNAFSGFDQLSMNGNIWRLSGPIVMTGTTPDTLLIQNGTLQLTGSFASAGGAQINAGATLLLGNGSTQSLSLNSPLGVVVNGTLGGYGVVNGSVQNQGVIAVADAAPLLSGQGDGVLFIQGSLLNNGTLDLRGATPGNVLHVVGNFGGQGHLLLNTALGNDASPSDRLVIDGTQGSALASGTTAIRITNVGGMGAPTNQGIPIVLAEGGATTGSSAFTLAGRVVAGLYEYELVRDPANQQWYLQSAVPPTPPPGPGPSPTPAPAPTPRYRPEIGTYIGNTYAAVTMFDHDLNDRIGNPGNCSPATAESDQEACASWVRTQGLDRDNSAVHDQVDPRTHQWLIQGGRDLGAWSLTRGADRLHLGLMVGYGHADTWSEANQNPNRASGGVDNYVVGGYGTWFQDDDQRLGAYVNSWLLYGWQHNQVSSDFLPTQSYHSNTETASIEAGYAVGPFGKQRIVMTPFTQFTWAHFSGSNIFEQSTDTQIQTSAPTGFSSRLGARISSTNDPTQATGWQSPYVELDWRHSWGQTTLTMNNSSVTLDGSANRVEASLGISDKLTKRWRFWLQAGTAYGSNVKQFTASLGVQGDY